MIRNIVRGKKIVSYFRVHIKVLFFKSISTPSPLYHTSTYGKSCLSVCICMYRDLNAPSTYLYYIHYKLIVTYYCV